MKKLILSIVAICLISSCSQDDANLQLTDNSSDVRSEKRTAAEAIDIANSIASSDNNTITHSVRKASQLSATPIIAKSTRSGCDTVLYAVDYNNNQGFALIATDRSVVPILAVIDEGSYNSTATETNEAFQFALNQAIAYASSSSTSANGIASGIDRPLVPTTWFEYSDTIVSRGKQTPRVTVKLGQYWPENVLCPNYVAGCASVGILQLLSGLKTPSEITYTYSGHDIQSETLDWDVINKHKFSLDVKYPTDDLIAEHLDGCLLDEDQHLTIARLVREIGNRGNADYSSAMITNMTNNAVDNALKSLIGSDCYSRGSSVDSLYEELFDNDTGIALIRAYGYYEDTTNLAGGHVWIADAVWEAGMIVHYYFYGGVVIDGQTPELVCATTDTIKQYIHYNWG